MSRRDEVREGETGREKGGKGRVRRKQGRKGGREGGKIHVYTVEQMMKNLSPSP